MPCGDLDGWDAGVWERGRSKRVEVYVMHIVDSLHCTAENAAE